MQESPTRSLYAGGRCDRDRMVVVFTNTSAIIAYQFVSDVRQVGGFLNVLRFPPPIKQTATI